MSNEKIEINQKLKDLKSSLTQVGSHLLEVANRFGADVKTRNILEGQLENIKENFLFVIVGEVNAGKSSFVNSLLNTPICETSHEICTQDVQKIIYGQSDKIIKDDFNRLVTREYPADILKEITIVDTPGTNSRELDHQIITEKFIPKCNLVVFVFQVDNIHVQSAWDLFKKIKSNWSKKVIFVLTKSDRYTEEEITNYSKILTKYAQKENIESPVIFATSAKLENEGEKEKSGFSPIRNYINKDVLQNVGFKKIAEDLKIIQKLMADIDEEFDLRKEKFDTDFGTRNRIDHIIKDKEDLAYSNIKSLTKRALEVYDQNSAKTLKELENGIGFFKLTFKSIKSMLGGESTKDWIENINKQHVENLNKEINFVLSAGIDNVKSDISYMVTGIKDELSKLNELKVQPSEMFANLNEKRREIIHSLKTNLTDFIDKSNVFKGKGILQDDKVDYTNVNIAGGVAAIGTTIALITNGSLLDITGGIATGLALLVAGGLAVSKKGKYLASVAETLAIQRDKFDTKLSANLKSYFNNISTEITNQFDDFDHHLNSEKEQIREYTVLALKIKNKLKTVEREV